MLITTLVTLAALPLSTLALSYKAFSSTNTCSGPSFGCSDNGGACCGGMPTGFGYSALFENLPNRAQGQGYSSGSPCTNFIFNVFGPGNKCWNSGGGSRASYLNWFHSPGGRRGIKSVSSSRDPNCTASFAYFEYTDDKGSYKGVKVPDGSNDAAQKMADYWRRKTSQRLLSTRNINKSL